MSLLLESLHTHPPGMEVKTYDGRLVHLKIRRERVDFDAADFLAAVRYVLTNTDLEPRDDPRSEFVTWVKALVEDEGYSPNRRRLVASQAAATSEKP